MPIMAAAGVTFSAYDENYLACDDCGGLVARDGYSFGVDPEDHACDT